MASSTAKVYSVRQQQARLGTGAVPEVFPAINTYVSPIVGALSLAKGDDHRNRLPQLVEDMLVSTSSPEQNLKTMINVLRRLSVHSILPHWALEPLLTAAENAKPEKAVRILFYLQGIVLSAGSGGTPVPLKSGAGGTFQPLAIEALPVDVLARAWLGLDGDVKSQIPRLSLRNLTQAARCALTTLPANAANSKKVAQLVAQLRKAVEMLLGAQAALYRNKKAAAKEILGTKHTEAAALLAARIGLPRREMTAMLGRIAQCFSSASPLAVRHGLAILCRIPSTKLREILTPLAEPLREAYDLYAPLGLLHDPAAAGNGVKRDGDADGVHPMALDDLLARIYLARLACKLVFSGVAAGSMKQFLWKVLMLLAFSPKEKAQVRLEVWKAMFGEVLPQPLDLFPSGESSPNAPPPNPFDDSTEQQLGQFKASAWRLTSVALQPKEERRARRRVTADAAAPEEDAATGGQFKLQWMLGQLLAMLRSNNPATVCGSARCLRAIAEARARAVHADGEAYAEDPRVTDVLQNRVGPTLRAVLEAGIAPAVQTKVLDALLWLHLPSWPAVHPHMFYSAVHNASRGDVTATFRPWPVSDVTAVLNAVDRRMYSAPELSTELLACVSALAAGAPSSMNTSLLMRLWSRAISLDQSGETGAREAVLKAAVDLLAAPPPPMCRPRLGAQHIEVSICMKQVHAWSTLKLMAAFWIGEHANQACNEYCWYPPPSVPRKAPESHEKDAFGEPEMLALMALRSPSLMAVISQLQRAALGGAWQLRVGAVAALAKIAVKSEEPFRLHCYSILTALKGNDITGHDKCDALGLTSVITPILKVLDDMYAGQIVMKQYCDHYGLDWTKWDADLLESVQQRHAAVVNDVHRYITTNVPEGAFFPLGIKSQILLTNEPIVLDPNALAEMEEHAIAKAEAEWYARQQQLVEMAGHEEYAEGEFVDERAESAQLDSKSASIESVAIEDLGDADMGLELDADAGYTDAPEAPAGPAFDPYNPDAWAEANPELFAGAEQPQEEVRRQIRDPRFGDMPGKISADGADSSDDEADARPPAPAYDPNDPLNLGPAPAEAPAAAAPTPPEDAPPAVPITQYGTVVEPFDAEHEDECTVAVGDVVVVIQALEGDWYYVQRTDTERVGLVPQWAVELTPPDLDASYATYAIETVPSVGLTASLSGALLSPTRPSPRASGILMERTGSLAPGGGHSRSASMSESAVARAPHSRSASMGDSAARAIGSAELRTDLPAVRVSAAADQSGLAAEASLEHLASGVADAKAEPEVRVVGGGVVSADNPFGLQPAPASAPAPASPINPFTPRASNGATAAAAPPPAAALLPEQSGVEAAEASNAAAAAATAAAAAATVAAAAEAADLADSEAPQAAEAGVVTEASVQSTNPVYDERLTNDSGNPLFDRASQPEEVARAAVPTASAFDTADDAAAADGAVEAHTAPQAGDPFAGFDVLAATSSLAVEEDQAAFAAAEHPAAAAQSPGMPFVGSGGAFDPFGAAAAPFEASPPAAAAPGALDMSVFHPENVAAVPPPPPDADDGALAPTAAAADAPPPNPLEMSAFHPENVAVPGPPAEPEVPLAAAPVAAGPFDPPLPADAAVPLPPPNGSAFNEPADFAQVSWPEQQGGYGVPFPAFGGPNAGDVFTSEDAFDDDTFDTQQFITGALAPQYAAAAAAGGGVPAPFAGQVILEEYSTEVPEAPAAAVAGSSNPFGAAAFSQPAADLAAADGSTLVPSSADAPSDAATLGSGSTQPAGAAQNPFAADARAPIAPGVGVAFADGGAVAPEASIAAALAAAAPDAALNASPPQEQALGAGSGTRAPDNPFL